ncbi:Protein-S-isoprenylcysteine O-methyltransferase B [Hypsizygus marmoreus]|uniref:Protein-S-isoprenylcysteine O-methyltransferase B n=1 Tax=Hypsizygus marmoreus TaxID=39966 RepID=A0A369JR95_HYPMA|nr:Protein-S-isoprenylcysteine O-methyltransferase B [Hypsizygus marmoreus]
MTPLVRILCIIATTVGIGVSLTDPNPLPPSSKEQRTPPTILGRYLRIAASKLPFLKVGYYIVGAAEIATLIAARLPSSDTVRWILSALSKKGAVANLRLTPFSTVGMILVIAGCLLRIQCFRTMGRFFTFQVSLRDNHQLVTKGPYSVVRHPGYTGVLGMYIGVVLWYGSRGSWVRESGLLETVLGKAFVGSFASIIMGSMMALTQRTWEEDKLLRNAFGEKWDEWARRVPYRLIPGIF